MAPTSFLCTISALLLPRCLRSESSSPPQTAQRKTREVVCNQYGRRLYLRPIMPPTTRKQSRLGNGGASAPREIVDGGNRGRSVSRKNSIGRADSVQLEEVLQRTHGITFNMQLPWRGREDEIREDADDEDKGLKERTLSMELSDAIEALHRDEEDVQEYNEQDVLEIVDTKDDSEEAEQDIKDSDENTVDTSSRIPTPQRSTSRPSSPSRIPIVGADPTNRPDLYSHAPTAPVARIVAPAPLREPPTDRWVMYYDCAQGCLEPVRVVQGEPMRCKECGVWMVFKKRTKRLCIFEAR